MVRVVVVLVSCWWALAVAGCSDLSSGDSSCSGTLCQPDAGGKFYDPEPQTKLITLVCMNNITDLPFTALWELSVDPGPIVAGEPFGALIRGTIIVDECIGLIAQIPEAEESLEDSGHDAPLKSLAKRI